MYYSWYFCFFIGFFITAWFHLLTKNTLMGFLLSMIIVGFVEIMDNKAIGITNQKLTMFWKSLWGSVVYLIMASFIG